MQTTIQKWGNSQGVRLKQEILKRLRLSEGDNVTISVKSGNIVMSPVRDMKREKKIIDLRKVLSKVPKSRQVKEYDWGETLGGEVW